MIPHLRPLMVRVGRDFFGNAEDAEDVAQDSLIRLWTYCERLDAQRNLEALAIMVAKNICVQRYHRLEQLPTSPLEESLAPCTTEADASLLAEEAAQRVDHAMRHLSPRERSLFKARHVDDKSVDEIAARTGLPKPSVKSMISMAKAKLKRLIDNEE